MIRSAIAQHAATLKRLYTHPGSGALVGMESTARVFPEGLGQLISFRDRYCRHPYCDAAIGHLDHIRPHADGGSTSWANGQGLCAHHNLVKEANRTTTRMGATLAPTPDPAAEPCTLDRPCTGDKKRTPAGNREAMGESCPAHDAGAVNEDPAGAIITRLTSGAEFISPARDFPHESPATVAASHYWAGHRAGREEAESALAEREAVLQDTKDRVEAKYARVAGIRAALTRRVKRLITEEEDLGRRQADVTAEGLRLGRAFKTLEETRAQIDIMHLAAETAQIAAEDAQASAEDAQRQAEVTLTKLLSDRTGLNHDELQLKREQARLAKDRSDLDQAWDDLAERLSQEAARSRDVDELWLGLVGAPTAREMMIGA
jgi:hypothetical protein